MRTLLAIFCSLLLFSACQEQRYFEEAPEIESFKGVMKAYEAGNFDAYSDFYADTAKIYYNTTEAKTLDQTIEVDKEGVSPFAEYGFGEEDMDFELVITNEGNRWVGFWGVWTGKIAANGQEISTPVHISARFVDGKIVEEWGYWDNQPMFAAMTALAAQEAAASEEGEE
jgi:hypothetical protein